MPTKRKRVLRQNDLLVAERCWLTGEPYPEGHRLWQFRQGPQTVARCKQLIDQYRHLIPRGRMSQLQRDIRSWSPIVPRGLARYR